MNDFATLTKSSPDGKLNSKDPVYVNKGVKSIVMGYDVPEGTYYIDSYENEDDSVFIVKSLKDIPNKPQRQPGGFCYNVFASEVVRI